MVGSTVLRQKWQILANAFFLTVGELLLGSGNAIFVVVVVVVVAVVVVVVVVVSESSLYSAIGVYRFLAFLLSGPG